MRSTITTRSGGAAPSTGSRSAVIRVPGAAAGLRFGGFPAFLAWALIHILFLIGFRNRLMVMTEWIWMFLTFGRGVRLITGEDRVPRPVRPPPDPRLLPGDERH